MDSIVTKKPIIGITCGEIANKFQAWAPITFGQARTYVDSVIEAGGIPVLIPLTTDKAMLHELGTMFDGLLLAGGNDLTPSLYGQQPVNDTAADYSVLRDTTEVIVLKQALERQIPILGICRGMQLLNVHFGGTLYQDIPTQVVTDVDHDSSTKLQTLVDLSHELHVQPGSKLAVILQTETIGANAHHHQAIADLGTGIEAVAWAEDGVIEALEVKAYPYMVGIQAHPESLTTVEPRWRQLFASFVSASQKT